MVHSEVYLNKCVVSNQHSAVLYTCLPWLLSKYNINIKKLLFFACFRFLIFHPFFIARQVDDKMASCLYGSRMRWQGQ